MEIASTNESIMKFEKGIGKAEDFKIDELEGTKGVYTKHGMLVVTSKSKRFHSPSCNYAFNRNNGDTFIWGKTQEEDIDVTPFPVILDMEITSICSGIGNEGPCPFCYKANTAKGTYMSFEVAKSIIDKMPLMLTQIAFGLDAKCESNPDWFKIFQYAKSKSFTPNVTVADISQETAEKLASVCGAVAVSRYAKKEYCYNSVKKLSDAGMKQVNMHIMLSAETKSMVKETLHDIVHDKRLSGLNAIVFLSLKRKGRGSNYTALTTEEFKEIIELAHKYKIHYGFDSCSAHKYLAAIKDFPKYDIIKLGVESCESSCQSAYINEHGEYFPCSFTEGTPGWETGIKLSEYYTFDDVWNHPRTIEFRNKLLANNRACIIYEV
jgi:hypothetical protein